MGLFIHGCKNLLVNILQLLFSITFLLQHEFTLYPLKGGKVVDILYEAAKKLNLDLKGPVAASSTGGGGATGGQSSPSGSQTSQQLMMKELVGT